MEKQKSGVQLPQVALVSKIVTKEWATEPGNGIRIGNDFKLGKSIKFICDDDFERVGKKTIQCLDGKWSHKIPQCKGKRCIR